MNLRVTVACKDKWLSHASAVKASLNRAFKYAVVDAKPSDLHLARLKSR